MQATFVDTISNCEENQCSCLNGVGATGTECPTHDAWMCASCTNDLEPSPDGLCFTCADGYWLDSYNECRSEEDKCLCAYGVGKPLSECPSALPGESYCSSCDDGWQLG